MSDDDRPVFTADQQAYLKPLEKKFKQPLPGGSPADRELKASPFLQQIIDRWKKGEDY